MNLHLLVLLLAAAIRLAFGQETPEHVKATLESKGKVAEPELLHRFFAEDWQYLLHENPELATYTGFPGQNDRWTDNSLGAIERRKRATVERLKALQSVDPSPLDARDELSYALFERQLKETVEGQRFPSELLPMNQMEGVQQDIAQMMTAAPFNTPKDYDDAIARFRAAPKLIEETIALMERGLERKITPPRITLRDVAQQIRNQIVEDLSRNPLYRPFTNFPASIGPDERKRLEGAAATAIREAVLPAYRRLEKYFTQTYLPKCREEIGMNALPDGNEWYAYNARRSTTTTLTPRQIHEIGLSEVKRIRGRMDQIIAETGFKGSFAEFGKFLRTDPRFFYTRAEDLVSGYRGIAKRADPELPKLFGKLPRLPYGVVPVPSYAEKSQTAAYYMPGAAAFGRAGNFYCNTYDLGGRPKWEMEALTLHEAVPGHHLQIALAQELEQVPDFRRHAETTAFVEGWGLYSESLGSEMGFYTDPYARFGQATFEMWRAIRLVVDTGMHALGWSRDEAIRFFLENSARAEHDVVVEVDRYIVWPGQALAYKIGELKIKELRRDAEKALGNKFDIRKFHDELLGQGALPLEILEQRMRKWIEATRSSAPDKR